MERKGRSAKVDLRSIPQVLEHIFLFLGPAQHTVEDTGPKSPSLSEAVGQCHPQFQHLLPSACADVLCEILPVTSTFWSQRSSDII